MVRASDYSIQKVLGLNPSWIPDFFTWIYFSLSHHNLSHVFYFDVPCELPEPAANLLQLSFLLPHFPTPFLRLRVPQGQVAGDEGGDKGGAGETSGEAEGADGEAAAAFSKGGHV